MIRSYKKSKFGKYNCTKYQDKYIPVFNSKNSSHMLWYVEQNVILFLPVGSLLVWMLRIVLLGPKTTKTDRWANSSVC